MVSVQEIELLAGILQRAGVTQIEAMFLNGLMDRLRAMVTPDAPDENAPELDTDKKV